MEAKRSPVGTEMAVEVMPQETCKLLAGLNVGTGIDHVTTRQAFIESRVITPVELVHHHFPNRVASAGAILGVTVALVGHSEVEGVRPDWDSAKRCRD